MQYIEAVAVLPDYFVDAERRRQLVEQTRENSARVARCVTTHTTIGYGVVVVPEPVYFDVTFIEEPGVTSGMAFAPGDPLRLDEVPRGSAAVYAWEKNDRGYFIGARLMFIVEQAGNAITGVLIPAGAMAFPLPGYQLHHHVVFDGVAMKDLPVDVMTMA